MNHVLVPYNKVEIFIYKANCQNGQELILLVSYLPNNSDSLR